VLRLVYAARAGVRFGAPFAGGRRLPLVGEDFFGWEMGFDCFEIADRGRRDNPYGPKGFLAAPGPPPLFPLPVEKRSEICANPRGAHMTMWRISAAGRLRGSGSGWWGHGGGGRNRLGPYAVSPASPVSALTKKRERRKARASIASVFLIAGYRRHANHSQTMVRESKNAIYPQ
jgi:hypothetical protein